MGAVESCKEVCVFQEKEKHVKERRIKFIIYEPHGKVLTSAFFHKGKEGLLSVCWLSAASE